MSIIYYGLQKYLISKGVLFFFFSWTEPSFFGWWEMFLLWHHVCYVFQLCFVFVSAFGIVVVSQSSFLRSVSIIFAVVLSLTPEKKLLFHPSPIVCKIAVGLECNSVCVCFPSNESPLKCLASVWEFWVTGLLKIILYSIHTWSPPFSSAWLAQAPDFRPV